MLVNLPARREPKPEWLKVRMPGGERYNHIKSLLRGRNLHTVCEEAQCPNVGECWGGGTATFMLMGDVCTRGCRFCAVKTGNPKGALDAAEPAHVAETVADLGLDYIVLTSVDRDDLPDHGADHFARTVEEIKRRDPRILVEILTGDCRGDRAAVRRLAGSGADVLAHNVETVERLHRRVRDVRARYEQSLEVLEAFKAFAPRACTKSSLMLGLGETDDEVERTLVDLRGRGVDILTLGQYLRPSAWHLPVAEYVTPDRFEAWRRKGESLGFLYVASGPLVRSSYRAGEFFIRGVLEKRAHAEDGR